MIWANKFFLQGKTRSRVRWIEGRWCWLMGLQIMWGNLVTLSSTGCPSPYFTIVLISHPTTFSSLLPEALIKSFTTCQFFWVTQLNVNINLLPVILFFFDVTFGAVHIVRTQQGGEGGSPKCVQMRAGGRGAVWGLKCARKRPLFGLESIVLTEKFIFFIATLRALHFPFWNDSLTSLRSMLSY